MFQLSLVPNWKQLLGKSLTHWMIYLGLAAEAYMQFAKDDNLPSWAFVALLCLIGGGRIIDQGLSLKDDTTSADDDHPIGI